MTVRLRATLLCWLTIATSAAAQTPSTARTETGWQITGIPAINFDADEGFGYGAIVQAYNYGNGATPYRYTIQPTLFFTTKGRRDASIFFDAPELLPSGWRIGAYVARLQQLATPYYGIGNASVYDASAERGPNPYYYRFGREGVQVTTDVQHQIVGPLRVLIGIGARTSNITATPFDSGTTLVAEEARGLPIPHGQTSYARLGLVWDTRDREIGPRSGTWLEGIVQRAGQVAGGTTSFTRATTTLRGYFSLTERLTFAERVIGQVVRGTIPFYELSEIQGSYQDTDGIGGSGTVRGLPKDRYVGKGIVVLNNEARFRAADFSLLGRPSALVLSAFVDAGRIWSDQLDFDEIGSAPHTGAGGGVRLQYGPSFVVAVDVAHSREATAPMYIGLGYLY
jgi:outer membrane protein assembly factor BamA